MLRKTKRGLAALVALALAVALTPPPSYAERSSYAGHWAAGHIDYLVGEGVVEGDEKGGMNPDGQITRAELAAVVNRAFGFSGDGAETGKR